MSERNKTERIERLHTAIASGQELKPLMAPPIQGFFNAQEAELIKAMIEAKPTDDEARRDAALELAALKRLRSRIASAVRLGEQARETLNKLTENKPQ